ncbi:MAG: DUF1802 family protein [Nostoc sp. DedQUE08]|uniref:DUF1802 family protein n=1 Tax=unclassified Nostoc TaxID=2593658 RepID=UPI002AD5058E|nr:MULTISPECIES: DUF1802 family protein [unclassified Nostoc]MDZ8068021.1 DUF1802 family protein [Nostoc sp. DedQUE08]MDZ8096277.1 DUF1802 family protein [Nostoc sp. DedQUE05]
MSNLILLNTALCLPSPDVEGLLQGRIIIALPRTFIHPGRSFALYPSENSTNVLPNEEYYKSNLLTVTQKSITQISSETVCIQSWGKCELCQIVNNSESLKALSQLNIWTTKGLQEILLQRKHIFLAYLRVYLLSEPIEIAVNPQSQFIGLPDPLKVSVDLPVLNDRTFAQRKRQLEKLEPLLHPELEELQSAIASLTISQPAAKQLDDDIKLFLGWSSAHSNQRFDSDLVWIKKIADVGNSSDGNEFERLVRRSLIKLGFSCSNTNPKANLDPDKLGGAGGVDFYCEYPYPVVGECKATKSENVPSKTPGQLIQLGKNHLQEKYDSCLKIIVAAGELTSDALLTTKNNQMSVIRPETLQKLVELQVHYKNSINLLELKECLQQPPFGLAEDKINTYIYKVEQSIKLRSHITQLVKNYLENSGIESAGVEALHGAYFGSHPPQRIQTPEMHEILIELSSPLTGYLGRIKGSDWKSDRFYFLRNLPIN